MLFKKADAKPVSSGNQRSEFNERVAQILLAVCRGMSKWVPSTDPLQKKIQELLKVLKKAARPKPASGLAWDIQQYFEKINLEDTAKNLERKQVNSFFTDLETVIGRMSSSSGGINKEMGGVISDFEMMDTADDLQAAKNKIIQELSRIQEETGRMEEELDMYRKKTESLAQKLQETETLGFTDQLTGVYNRHAFEVQVNEWFAEGKAKVHDLSFVMVDIDEFKKFNDTHGHLVGDMILKFVADSLNDALGTEDKLFRYGGEEFLVLLPAKDVQAAGKLAEKMRKQLEKDYYIEKNKKLQVTISVGVACANEAEDLAKVLERTDQALYTSKNGGRNRVTLAS